MTLYLKYRPQNVSELDLVSVREQLTKILESKNIPHAFLFSGSRGTGKTSSARILAKTINNLDSLDTPDIIELDAASHRGIDEIRTIREQVALSPLSSKYKVYIIDEVHMLTTEAANALLKTLEEPPAHVIFVLCTTDPQKLPETIVSRCTQIHFVRPSLTEIVNKLTLVAKEEKFKINNEDLESIAKKAKGSFRDAIKILEQVILFGKFEPDFGDPQEFLDLLSNPDTQKTLDFIEELVKQGVNLRTFVERCVEVLRDKLLETKDKNIISQIEDFEKVYLQLKDTAVPQLPLEIMVISMTKPQIPSLNTPTPVSPYVGGDVERVLDKWPEILRVVRPFNHSIEGLLRSTKPVSFDGTKLTLEAFYVFHKDKLSEEKSRKIVEDAVAAVLEAPKIVLNLVLGKAKPQEDLSKVAEGIFK
ncbi:MAG: DNA polymerase III subunit gamma/tau [Patescibacteria group bacterium]